MDYYDYKKNLSKRYDKMKEYADEINEYYKNPEKLKEKARDIAIEKSKK